MTLRLRVLLAVGVVLIAAVAAVGWVARRATDVSFHKFLDQTQLAAADLETELAEVALEAEELLAQGDWPAVSRWLAERQAGDPNGRVAVVLDEQGRLLAASAPTLKELDVTVGAGGELHLRRESPSGAVEAFALVSPSAPLRGPAGGELGRLYLLSLPGAPGEGLDAEAGFRGAVDRWLMVAVLAVGLAAFGAIWLSTRGLLAPIEDLTAAARRLERGDLGQRVEVRTGDEIGQLAVAFNAMAASLARNEALRRDMVSDTAHELRTPITNLRCQLEALRDGVSEASHETAGSLLEEVLHLQSLVEGLQELALADAGQLRIEPEAVEVAAAAERAVESVRRSRSVSPEIRLRLDGLPAVRADPQRLQQILTNLIDNAVIHGAADQPIEVEGRAGPQRVELRVTDRGPGLAPDQLERVFDRYYRTDPSRQRASGGAGLGLAIVKELVEAQGGRVSSESERGRRTTFAFTLPIA